MKRPLFLTVAAVCMCVASVVSAQLPEMVRFQPGSYGFGGAPYRSAPVQFATAGGHDYVLMNDMAYQSLWGYLIPVPNSYGPFSPRIPSYGVVYHAPYYVAPYPAPYVVPSPVPPCCGGGTPHVHATTPPVIHPNTTRKPAVAPAKPAVSTPAKPVNPPQDAPLVIVKEQPVRSPNVMTGQTGVPVPTFAPTPPLKQVDETMVPPSQVTAAETVVPVIPTITDRDSPFEILPPASETVPALPPMLPPTIQETVPVENIPTPTTDSSDPFGSLF